MTQRGRKRATLVLGTLVPLALLIGCGSPPARETDDPLASRPPVDVRTARVRMSAAAGTEAPGTVEAATVADVASRIAAVIETIEVDAGDAVRRGQVLARLDGRDLRARVGAADASLRAAVAQHERIRSLFEKEAATRQELDAAEEARAAAEAGVSAAKAQLDYVVLRAPFDGRVVAKTASAGDLASPGRPLMTLQAAGLMRAVATVSPEQVADLTVGSPVGVALGDGRTLQAALSVISPASDPASRRFLVKADLPLDAGVRAGSFVRLLLPPTSTAGSQPVAPKTALVEHGALTGLYLVKNGRARLVWISPGPSVDDGVIVRAGLSEGDEVILDPAGLVDGAPVHAASPEAVP